MMRLGAEAYQILLDSAPDGIVVVDDGGRIAFVNVQVEQLFGYTRDELIGLRVEVLLPDQLRRAHLGHRDAYFRDPRTRAMGSALDLVARRKDGTEFPVEISLSPLRGEGLLFVTAIVRDVSERRRTQEALRRSEELYRLLTENAEDIIYRLELGTPMRIGYISPSIRMTGYDPEAFYADANLLLAVVHPDDRGLMQQAFESPNAPRSPLTVRIMREDRVPRWLEHRLRVVRDARGEEIAIEGFARDISDRVEVEEQRRLVLAESEMERDRERIAADLHDGVMQSIFGAGLSLRRAASDLGDDHPEVRARITESIEGLSGAIADMRRYVMDLRPVQFTGDLERSLRDVVRLFEAGAGIPTLLELDSPLPQLPDEHALAVFHVAREALSNVRRHANATEVTISLRRGDRSLELLLRDNGVGFDMSGPRTGEHLGLRNMEMRTRSVGGTLTIASTPGRGTTLLMVVPLDGHAPEPGPV